MPEHLDRIAHSEPEVEPVTAFGAMSLRSSRRAFAIAGVTLGGIAVAIVLAWVGFFGWAMLNADYTPPPVTPAASQSVYTDCMQGRGGSAFWHGYCQEMAY